MKSYKYLLLSLISLTAYAEPEIPTGLANDQVRWQENKIQSDNFNNNTLDTKKWENAPKSLNVGAWTFTDKNAYLADGKLNIAVTQDTHTRSFNDSCWDGVAGGPSKKVDRKLYYRSGAVRTAAEDVYGFYEASIKGVNVFPGLSPAFWLYSDNHPYPDKNDKSKQYVDYSEIDIVELQQADWRSPTDFDGISDMDHNLHARVEENGRIVWKRPKPNPKTQLLHYKAPFDPSKGFHTYAVENRRDRIFWYVDGVLVGSKANTWWHRPMHMIFSMGLRRQFIHYNAPCQRADPNAKNVVSEGFPEDATMQIDYVKVWKAQPSVWFEQAQQYQQLKQNEQNVTVTLGYHGGSDSHVVVAKHQGVTLNFIEKNAAGTVKVLATAQAPTTAQDENKRYGGDVSLTLDISGFVKSAELAQGHYYQLEALVDISNGETVKTVTPVNLL